MQTKSNCMQMVFGFQAHEINGMDEVCERVNENDKFKCEKKKKCKRTREN